MQRTPTIVRIGMLAALLAPVSSCALVMDLDFGRYGPAKGGSTDGGADDGAGGYAGEDDGTAGGAGASGDADGGAAGAGGQGGSGGTSGTGGSGGAPPDAGCTGPVSINELQTHGASLAHDEFVELYNANDCTVLLGGYGLYYRSSAGTSDAPYPWQAPAGAEIPANGFYVVSGVDFGGVSDSHFPDGMALSSTGGGLALKLQGTIVDSMGWGAATNDYVVGSPAPAPADGASVGRLPDGAESGDNYWDFYDMTPSPGAANQ